MRVTRRLATLLSLSLLGLACGGDGGVPSGGDSGPDDAGIIDAWTTCPPEPPAMCDFFLSCGCDTPAEKCTAGASGVVCDTAGAVTAGEECTYDDECTGGTICTTYAGSMVCRAFCDPAHPCPDGEACYLTVTDRAAPPNPIGKACAQVCSLLEQDCVGDVLGCYESKDHVDEPELGICLTAGTAVQDEACVRAADCAEGYLCMDVSGGAMSECRRICDTDGDPPCPAGACQPLPGHLKTGVCLTP
jgi:hypothetical protein